MIYVYIVKIYVSHIKINKIIGRCYIILISILSIMLILMAGLKREMERLRYLFVKYKKETPIVYDNT